MRKTPIAEWLLTLFAGRERAAAIMGDLEELAATRGSLWFWTAYARTLVTLGWRTPVAFLIAMVSMRFIFRAVVPLLEAHHITHFLEGGLFGVYNLHVRLINWNLTLVMARFLIFALPFVAVRFGLRNRLTQLTCALLLIAVPVYSLRPWVMDLSGILIVTAIVAALIVPHWRRPMIVLAATCVTATAAVATCFYILVGVFHQNILIWIKFCMWICEAIGFALAVIVCVYLHGWLLERPPISDRTIA